MKNVIIFGIGLSAFVMHAASCCETSQANKSIAANSKDSKCSHCGKTSCNKNCSAGTAKKDTLFSTNLLHSN
jgi:hypothetical protein